jgi:hypothetical protein
MSLQPDHDLLCSLRHMREKINLDPMPRTPSLQQLYALLVRRISQIEDAQTSSHAETRHA